MKKPNIVFLIQDQMQQQVLREESGCIMPNLWQMMEDSVEFERAYSCNAVCSPARASLMTGVLPHIHGMVDCTHTVPQYRADYDDTLDTFTRVLSEEGYHVSYYGKWHIERTHELEKFGIEDYITERNIPGMNVTMQKRVVLKNTGYADRVVCGVFEEGIDHTEEYYVYQKAMDDIEKHRNDSRPFCTFISTYAPHDPYCVPREVYEQYEKSDLGLPHSFDDEMKDKPVIYQRMRSAIGTLTENDFRMAKRCYYSYCTLVDIQIGKLISYLKENQLYENTMIVCMSDHGDLMGAHGLMMKSVEPFEEIYHIPLIMKLPYQKQAGEKKKFYIGTCEVAPTVLEILGCRPLKGKYVNQSVVPYMTGEKADSHFAFAEFFGQRFAYTQRICWKDNLKYLFNAFDNDELYDLDKDPDELTNLNTHSEYQEKKEELCELMWEQIKKTDDMTMLDAEYYLMRFAPVGPGEKKRNNAYSIYNKSF